MNRRILKAHRADNDFKADWYRSQRWLRMTGIERETGVEAQIQLLRNWLKARKVWC